jgi:hypothetical protein
MHRFAPVARLFGGILILSSLPASSQTPALPLKSIFGIYGQPGTGRNSIQVIEKANGKIGVDLKLYYANGHTCRFNKDGDWLVDHIAVVADGLDRNKPCRLNAFFDKDHVLLKDEGLQCAPVYCGTRGTLDNVNLPKYNPSRK